MSFAKKYSRTTPKYLIKINSPAYCSLPDLYKENGERHVYPICGIYINKKGRYGPQACLAIDDRTLVNLPTHLTDVCEEMRADDEATEAINNGLAGFRIYQYASKSNRVCYSVEWVDIE